MQDFIISHITSTSPDYAEVFELREEILRKPLGMSLKNEDLSRDHTDVIFTGKVDGKIIACLMLHHKDADRLQLRQMAVYTQWQGSGYGRKLVQAAEEFGKQKGYKKMILHARKEATGFYESMGYAIHGDSFTEIGIPHFIMEKQIGS